MKKTIYIIVCAAVCSPVAWGIWLLARGGDTTTVGPKDPGESTVSNFAQCVDAGGTVQTMSRPRQCTLSTGESFSDETETAASGEPDRDAEATSRCVPSGCSSHICVDEKDAGSLMTTCEYREEYGCYKAAVCQRQKDGRCGWTTTRALTECLNTASKELDVPGDASLNAPSRQTPPSKDSAVEEDDEPLPTEKTGAKRVSLVSWGFKKSSTRDINTVILHSSYNSLGGEKFDVDAIVAIYKKYEVSAHYIVGRDGDVTQLVKEADIAYHAGVSSLPDGRTDVNGASIGIEIVGDESSSFTDSQYEAVNGLIAEIRGRHGIKYVLGHSDIAPGRKTDPWAIDWKKVKK